MATPNFDSTRSFDTLGLLVLTHTSRYLDECLQSVLAQTRTPTRSVLVDNGSPPEENVGGIARSYGFEVVRSDRPLPFTAGRNLGCQALYDCDLIVNLDGDDVLLPRYIEEYWRAAAAHRVDIVYGCAEFFGTRSGIFGADFGRPFSQIREGNFIPANSLFSREMWRQVGGFDPQVGLIDDWDLWLSCAEAGATIHFIGEPLWRYRRHDGSNLSTTNDSLEADRAASVAAVKAKHERYIDGVGSWRRGARLIDRRTGRLRRGVGRRAQRLIERARRS